MSSDFASFERHSGWNILMALVDADGSARHPFIRSMSKPQATTRDLADAIHLLCALHGAHPSMMDHALAHASPEAAAWLEEAAAGFTEERALLARLTAAAGPIPSTPGQAETEAAVAAQRHALDMLARSDRAGCATGAAMALVLDWHAVRGVMNNAADRAGFAPLASTLPIDADTATLAATMATRPALERAMGFGAQQLLAQHRALWSLADARQSARNSL